MNVKDFIGQDINVGDRIVYAVRGSSRIWLTEALVQQVREEIDRFGRKHAALRVLVEENRYGYTRKSRRALHRFDHIVKIGPKNAPAWVTVNAND